MGYHVMTDDEWLAFLRAEPARPAVLGTVRADGRPHVAPVWYDLDGTTVVLTTGERTVKGRNLRRDSSCTLCVQDDRAPYSFVVLGGAAELSEDLAEVRRWAARIGGRYLGADRAEEMGERNGVPGEMLVRVAIERVVSAADVAD